MSHSFRPHRLYSPWDSPGQNTGVGSPSLLQGIFPIQGLKPGLVHCRQILYHLLTSSQFTGLWRSFRSMFSCISSSLIWKRWTGMSGNFEIASRVPSTVLHIDFIWNSGTLHPTRFDLVLHLSSVPPDRLKGPICCATVPRTVMTTQMMDNVYAFTSRHSCVYISTLQSTRRLAIDPQQIQQMILKKNIMLYWVPALG